jgi:hypothetical protein
MFIKFVVGRAPLVVGQNRKASLAVGGSRTPKVVVVVLAPGHRPAAKHYSTDHINGLANGPGRSTNDAFHALISAAGARRTSSTFSAIAYFNFSMPSPVTAEIAKNSRPCDFA